MKRRRFLTLFGIGLGISGFVPQLFTKTNRLRVRTYRQYPDGNLEFDREYYSYKMLLEDFGDLEFYQERQ